jgi:hypothetical protein
MLKGRNRSSNFETLSGILDSIATKCTQPKVEYQLKIAYSPQFDESGERARLETEGGLKRVAVTQNRISIIADSNEGGRTESAATLGIVPGSMMSEQFESKYSSAWPLHSDQTVASPPLPGIVALLIFSQSCFD